MAECLSFSAFQYNTTVKQCQNTPCRHLSFSAFQYNTTVKPALLPID